jgi:hypothetical protein
LGYSTSFWRSVATPLNILCTSSSPQLRGPQIDQTRTSVEFDLLIYMAPAFSVWIVAVPPVVRAWPTSFCPS